MDDDELLDALGVEVAPLKTATHSPREERIIAGFEDILRFYEEHGRAPMHGSDRDIFERIYAVRLDRIRRLPEAPSLLAGLDTPGLLARTATDQLDIDALDEEQLLAALGVETSTPVAEGDITVLRHVRTSEEKRTAEEVANRKKCDDFQRFKPLFERVRQDLANKSRRTLTFTTRSIETIRQDAFLIVGGQIAYVADVGDEFTTEYGRRDSRLRVIFDNGTEAEVLLRSMQRALHRDEAARIITERNDGPLFGDTAEPEDIETGTIYVLRSLSDHPYVAEHRQLIHKIGVTGGAVETRIAGAESQTTYMLAKVEVVATYKLHNINRVRLEGLFHKIFSAAQLDCAIEVEGKTVRPREWFLVPLHIIDEAVRKVIDGTITDMAYDSTEAKLVKVR